VLLGLLSCAVRLMPPFGQYRGPYGDVLNRQTVFERHATDVVSAVNFDWRGIDTLGEESILFLSAIGVALLLRRQPAEEHENTETNALHSRHQPQEPPLPSEVTRIITLALIGPLTVFGIYVITHGQLTPGGGFQGGVILATAPLLVYLTGDFKMFRRVADHEAMHLSESLGMAAFVSVGFAGMVAGSSYLQNVVPLGKTGDLFSGGTIAVLNLSTGIAVGAGLVLVIFSFLDQTLEMRLGGKQ
jgi:multicomponent Na+:H+ antiporter subunit B